MASARLHSGGGPFHGVPEGAAGAGPAFLDLSAHVEQQLAFHDLRLSELRAAGGAPPGGFAPLQPAYFDHHAASDAFSPLAAWEGFAPTYHVPFELGPFGPAAGSARLPPAMTVQRGACKGPPSGSPASGSSGPCSGGGGAPSAGPHKGNKPRRRVATVAQRRAANIRERRRMFNLNSAFDKLRKKV
ncbi:unnamed protein product, partial [Ixodes hexagonus]